MLTDLRTRAGQVVEQLDTARNDDHERGCQMRFSMCTCGFDDACARTAGEAAAFIEALLAELDARADAERDRVVRWLMDPELCPFGKSPMHYAAAIAANEHRSEP